MVSRVEEVDRLLHPEGERSGIVCHRAASFLEVVGSADNGERHAARDLTELDHALGIDHALARNCVAGLE